LTRVTDNKIKSVSGVLLLISTAGLILNFLGWPGPYVGRFDPPLMGHFTGLCCSGSTSPGTYFFDIVSGSVPQGSQASRVTSPARFCRMLFWDIEKIKPIELGKAYGGSDIIVPVACGQQRNYWLPVSALLTWVFWKIYHARPRSRILAIVKLRKVLGRA
jgi:hypothetical protein